MEINIKNVIFSKSHPRKLRILCKLMLSFFIWQNTRIDKCFDDAIRHSVYTHVRSVAAEVQKDCRSICNTKFLDFWQSQRLLFGQIWQNRTPVLAKQHNSAAVSLRGRGACY